MYDVFLSHNRRQKPWVREFYRFLIKHGLKVFFDEDSIAPGESIIEAIERGIESSRHVVLILSPESLQSQWVAMETAWALHDAPGKKVVPVILEEIDLQKVRLGVRTLNAVNLSAPTLREERLRFLLRHLCVENADQLPASELGELLKTTDSSFSEQLQVADINDVLKWQWDGRKLLEKLIKLDYSTIEEKLNLLNEGDEDQWGPVFMNNPETWRLLITEPENIVGYWHIAPLFPTEYESAKRGQLLDSQITADTVQLFGNSDLYNIYFVQVCLHPQYRRPRQVRLLFETFFEVLDTLAADGIFISEICANAFTNVGVSLCRSFNLEWICKHSQHGEMYLGQISAVLKHSLARRFPELQRRYAKERLIEGFD